MENWQKLEEKVEDKSFNVKEYLSRSEGPELFTTALNDKLIAGAAPEIGNTFSSIYDSLQINRRNITFPSIRGVNPDLVPELGEFKFADLEEFTSITVTPQKFGMRMGISREMIEDNEVGLIGYRAREAGRAMRELERREHMKALSFYSTGPQVSTGVIGTRNHGLLYPQGGYTNVLSGTAWSWETRIHQAVTRLMNQTITVQDMTIDFPVMPDFILANPTHKHDISKVLNAGITVVAAGIGTGATNVAGSNIFQNEISSQIYDPIIPTGQVLIGAARRGLVSVRRTPLEVETMENKPFDADELKTRIRFLPAVVEERFILDLQISG